MVSFLELNHDEILTFFAVLVRFFALVLMIPFFGSRMVPIFLKGLFAVTLSAVIFPSLVASGLVDPRQAAFWTKSVFGIARVLGLELLFGALLGYTVRLLFESVHYGSSLMGGFIGFSAVVIEDSEQGEQRQVIGEFYHILAVLIFLSINGHHAVLRSALESYRWVAIGTADLSGDFFSKILELSALIFKYGVQLSAPVAVSVFAVNVAFAISQRILPQANLYLLSVSVTLFVGLFVMFFTLSDFSGACGAIFSKAGDWMVQISKVTGHG